MQIKFPYLDLCMKYFYLRLINDNDYKKYYLFRMGASLQEECSVSDAKFNDEKGLWTITVEDKTIKYNARVSNGFSKYSKISNTFLILFSNKLLVFRAGIHKMFVRIANRENTDQTASELQKQSDVVLGLATSVQNFRNLPYFLCKLGNFSFFLFIY